MPHTRILCDWLNCQGCPDCPDIPFGRPAEEVVAELKALDPEDATFLPPTDRSHKPGDDKCFCPKCVRVRSDAFLRERFGKTLPIHVQAERAEQRVVDLENERLDRLALSRLDRVNATIAPDVLADDTFESLRVDMTGDVDLSPTQVILETVDGTAVIYAGKVSWLYGEPSGGKSWVTIIVANEAVLQGGRVLVMDFEDTATTYKQRGSIIAFNPGTYDDAFAYFNVAVTDSPTAMLGAMDWMDGAVNPAMNLVIIDAAESSGCPSDGRDVMPWATKMIHPWRDKGWAVLVVDHVPKALDNRPMGPIGSQAKRAQITGAALSVRGTPWTKAADGKIYLVNEKDRPGDLPAGRGKCIGVIAGTWADVGGERAFGYTVTAGADRTPETPLNRQILQMIADAGVDGVKGKRTIRLKIQGGNDAKDSALQGLIDTGLVNQVMVGKTYSYTVTTLGTQLLAGQE